ncbi:1-(5-phosphoribosyl)-5-[(5-phosphoribosylamino)methylideneamino]imidazole-4-carboxamide isomerase [Anaerosporobacter faecicola]|uniref:1-(5-phosphoribosyl)-5-[(5- phosphoribosylamino)methylideneamino]imidazole-4- carboxamide isomerase n=1 Tax=Anaerosporobacter faecicola TaxID=2718714 RepID=UPI00143A6EF3|nr:1-(5-phosphoribosyl)-5-[(5-phosphoribosylamino)methylideneamino]imidazole-4-carboxamide isomerase [Anaerosporobacter faecicola]
MQLYPAIDIRNGQCVRLRQGQFHDQEIYSNSPVKVAMQWEDMGATFIHLVDLDGALHGHGVNEDVIKEITNAVSIPVQVGGGIRTIKDIENKMNLGVNRVIIGTKAVENPVFIKEAINTFGRDRIVVGIDAKNGMVAIEGWEKVSNYNAVTLAMNMKELGVKTIVYTDIAKDGMLQGPNIECTKEMVEATELEIIASGGVSSLKDLESVNQIHVHGAIIGKALYENRIQLDEAIRLFE